MSLSGWFVAAGLILGILLGGSTRPGYLSDAVLQLACLPALFILLVKITGPNTPGHLRWAALACMVPVFAASLQLIPLPHGIWSMWPVKPLYAQAFELGGNTAQWMPLSLDPDATRASLLALIPPVTIFLATLLIDRAERRTATFVLLAAGLVSVAVGIVQVSQGPASPLRFYPSTNPYEAVGFFANRNHFAALTYVLLLFAAVCAAPSLATRSAQAAQSRAAVSRLVVTALAWFTVLVVLLAAVALTRSRTGIVLAIAALLGAFVLALMTRRSDQSNTSPWLLMASVLGALMLMSQFVLFRIVERFSVDPLADGRIAFARNTYKAALAFTPFGSGLGTFVPVYASFEQPTDTIANIYANHAHNDFLEVWLEAGIPGLVMMALFALWLVGRSYKLMRHPSADMTQVDLALARAALIAVVLLSLHSLVDYPLRTSALMMTVAFCSALMLDPAFAATATSANDDERPQPNQAPATRQHLQYAQAAPATVYIPNQPATDTANPQARALWGQKNDWPKEWKTPPSGDAPLKQPSSPTEPAPSSDWWKKPPGR